MVFDGITALLMLDAPVLLARVGPLVTNITLTLFVDEVPVVATTTPRMLASSWDKVALTKPATELCRIAQPTALAWLTVAKVLVLVVKTRLS